MDISGQISGLIQYLKGSRLKGEKFKTEHKSFRDEGQDAVQSYYNQKQS
jgi:hypothetical protein